MDRGAKGPLVLEEEIMPRRHRYPPTEVLARPQKTHSAQDKAEAGNAKVTKYLHGEMRPKNTKYCKIGIMMNHFRARPLTGHWRVNFRRYTGAKTQILARKLPYCRVR